MLPGNISGSTDFFSLKNALIITLIFLLLLPWWHPLSSFAKAHGSQTVLWSQKGSAENSKMCQEMLKHFEGKRATTSVGNHTNY